MHSIVACMAKNHDETARFHRIIESLTCCIKTKKHPIPSAPAAKSLEGGEEGKLAYHQKLLRSNMCPCCPLWMSSKMGRFSNDITVHTYLLKSCTLLCLRTFCMWAQTVVRLKALMRVLRTG